MKSIARILLHIACAIKQEDTEFAFFHRLCLLHEQKISEREARLHTVTVDEQGEIHVLAAIGGGQSDRARCARGIKKFSNARRGGEIV